MVVGQTFTVDALYEAMRAAYRDAAWTREELAAHLGVRPEVVRAALERADRAPLLLQVHVLETLCPGRWIREVRPGLFRVEQTFAPGRV